MQFQLRKTNLILAGALALAAASLASAAQFEGIDRSIDVSRSGSDLSGHAVIEKAITTEIDEIYEHLAPVTVPVAEQVCADLAGDGRGDWKGFFNARREEKAERLSSAIRGVGISTAQRLVADGYFTRKPRSWEEFKSVINAADGQYHTGFSYEVLVHYASDNMVSLGYATQGNCHTETHLVTVLQNVRDRRFYRNVTRNFRVELTGGALLKQESESFRLSFDGLSDNVRANSGYNDYSVTARSEQGDTVVYKLAGARKAVAPVNTLEAIPGKADGQLTLQITDSAYDAQLGATLGQAVAVVKVYGVRHFWADKLFGTVEIPLNPSGATTAAKVDVRIDSGWEAYATLELKRIGSNYHSSQLSTSYKQTTRVKF